MRPIAQTVTEAGKGNCLAACIASILEVPIESIPDLRCGSDHAALEAFLATHGMSPVWLWCTKLASSYVGYVPIHCILIGGSPRRAGIRHAVVGVPNGYGYQIVHDPHPEGGGIVGDPVAVLYLGALLPGACSNLEVTS